MRKTSLVEADFAAELERLRGIGMRLDVIWPADDPHSAILSRAGESIRLESRPEARPIAAELPAFRAEFVLARAGSQAGKGRAGMLYRDLIPGRLGGRYIASHITIPGGGAVDDWVHYHQIAVQLLCVRKGWVRVVYEGQGEAFVMAEGDMVLQPPGIRHRVLECSAGFEVVEISAPAEHATFADHDIRLPGPSSGASDHGGQLFLHHVAARAPWVEWRGALVQETSLTGATAGLAEARIFRRGDASSIELPAHKGELVFGFMIDGFAQLDFANRPRVGPADSFVIPPGRMWGVSEASEDFRLLLVTTGSIPHSLPKV